MTRFLNRQGELVRLRPSVRFVLVDSATHDSERGILFRREFLAALRAFIGSAS